ncbi:MAG: sulfatase-like hydrolase/transferase, partial [Candidatus Aminicenantes bacterium]|nr:sulfatase-like hydrolase/transferase [Candidatus Aminicenantes bacterium]
MKFFAHLFCAFCCTLLFFCFFCCQKSKEDLNYILITLDTQRADFISVYNPQNASTPNIDSLAQLGTRYDNCFSLIPITLPSHASLFFSEPPHEIKNYNNGQIISERKKRPSFPALFQKNGYTTSAFISLGVLKSQFGLAENFDVYRDEFPENRWYLTAEEVNSRVFDWLDTKEDGKFFMWVHYSDPHDPYYPPGMPAELTILLDDEPVGLYHLGKYENNEIELPLKTGKNIIR